MPRPWAVAVFASRESPEDLLRTVQAVRAAATRPTAVDVLVNGNAVLAGEVATRVRDDATRGARLRVWHIALGDKAHCWNQYVHGLWPGGETAFFIDGYARPAAGSLRALADTLSRQADALAAAGLPSSGRGAGALREAMLREGGLHGNLFALRAETMRLLRERGFRLPLGVYRTDGILGAALSFGLDPGHNEWDPKRRIALAPGANWEVEPKRWWRWSDAQAQWRRLDRQAQGSLENRAVSDWLATRRRAPHELPGTVTALVSRWATEDPLGLNRALEASRRNRRAWERLQAPRDWSDAERPPALLADLAAPSEDG